MLIVYKEQSFALLAQLWLSLNVWSIEGASRSGSFRWFEYISDVAGLCPSTFADCCFSWRIEFYGHGP